VFGDLLEFDVHSMIWRNISILAEGPAPQARYFHGFVSTSRALYVFGGTYTIPLLLYQYTAGSKAELVVFAQQSNQTMYDLIYA